MHWFSNIIISFFFFFFLKCYYFLIFVKNYWMSTSNHLLMAENFQYSKYENSRKLQTRLQRKFATVTFYAQLDGGALLNSLFLSLSLSLSHYLYKEWFILILSKFRCFCIDSAFHSLLSLVCIKSFSYSQ